MTTNATGAWARLSSGSQTSSASRNARPSPIHNGGGALSRQNWYARSRNSGAISTPYDAQSIGPRMPDSRHATPKTPHPAPGRAGSRRRGLTRLASEKQRERQEDGDWLESDRQADEKTAERIAPADQHETGERQSEDDQVWLQPEDGRDGGRKQDGGNVSGPPERRRHPVA